MDIHADPAMEDGGSTAERARLEEGGPAWKAKLSELSARFEPDWPGFKFAMEIASPEGASAGSADAPGHAKVAVVAFWLEPGDVKAWALHCMLSCPDLEAKFPWTMESALAGLPVADDDSREPPIRPKTLGQWQALASLMWLMHPAYEAHDVAVALKGYEEEGPFAPTHVLQLPGSPEHGGNPGSGPYFRSVFSWRGKDPAEGARLVKAGTRAGLWMRDALVGSGALDESRWSVESSDQAVAAYRWRHSTERDMEALERMEGHWDRLDISRSATLTESTVATPRL